MNDILGRTGPWLDEASVLDLLHTSRGELEGMLERQELLRAEFADGTVLYPLWQFADARVVPGLRDVLQLLLKEGASMDGCILWLSSAGEDGNAMWWNLRMGRLPLVLRSAEIALEHRKQRSR
ncbi:hypothetical protein DF223_10750 [Mycetocola zhujimingii]|uniref:DNA-binding protein n=1 Tax=Mycetocola zhujimingii TaxID=2079792 RepID=A0A2U1TCR7_9MICO|nr:hypothetical protein DF223_10750 [Mycetocola zhujimingii]